MLILTTNNECDLSWFYGDKIMLTTARTELSILITGTYNSYH